MALSGSFNTSGYSDPSAPDYLTFSWTATQDIAANTSTVTWSVKAYGGASSGYYNTLFQRYTKVGNTTKQTDMNSPGTQTVYNGTTVYSDTEVISHNADGTGSFTATVKASFEYWTTSFNSTGSQTFTLDAIPRAATITSAPSFSDQDNPVLKYSNPAGTAATLQAAISLDGSTANVAYRTVTGSQYTFSLTTAERNVLRNATTGATRTVYYLLKTTIGSNTFTKSQSATFTVANVAENLPTVSNSATPDNTAIPSTYQSNFSSVYVQNFSKAAVTVTASAKYSASITGYNTSLNGKNYSGASFTSDVITGSGTLALTSTVTDSRGYTNSSSTNLAVYAYTNPIITGASIYRCDSGGTASDSGTSIKITATRGYASVNGINKAILRYKYKQSTTSVWGSWHTLIDRTSTSTDTYNAVISGTFAATTAYNFQLSVIDDLGKETTQSFDIPTEVVTVHLKEGGKAIGLGTYAGADSTVTSAWGFTASAGSITAPAGSVVAGTDGSTAAERQVEVRSGAGRMYMFSQASTTGARGLYLPAHGSGAAKSAIGVDTNNNVTFNGSLSGTATNATNATNIYAKSGSYKTVANTLLEMVYPVGSVYISTKNTSPATFLGGTWTRINGRFLLGLGSNAANTVTTYGSCAAGAINRTTAKELGGEVSHTLTTTEMPKHTHTRIVRVGASVGSYYGYPPSTSNSGTESNQGGVSEVGGSGAHNNMPPYIAVYMWERTA